MGHMGPLLPGRLRDWPWDGGRSLPKTQAPSDTGPSVLWAGSSHALPPPQSPPHCLSFCGPTLYLTRQRS